MAWGLKSVSRRRDDALSRVGWERLEVLLAEHYRREGYQVEHVGTGGTKHRFDGGIDLKLRKDDAYILVQCKHWNAYKVTHNAVHELLGLMVNEGATGAILVSSGEFTRAAIEAATRQGHVQLVDGDALREMIGPLPEPALGMAAPAIGDSISAPIVRARNSGHEAAASQSAGLVWKIAGGVIMGLLAFNMLGSALDSYRQRKAMEMFAQEMKRLAADPDSLGWRAAAASRQRNHSQTAAAIPQASRAISEPYTPPVPRASTAAEVRESQRKADEAINVIKDQVPEM